MAYSSCVGKLSECATELIAISLKLLTKKLVV
jgi:hypothetical protein